MAKVHPQSLVSSSSSCSSTSTSTSTSSTSTSSYSSSRDSFTLWMKSLVMNGNGCTVYDSDGRMVYRVDNYDYKCSDEVYLMDHCGRTLTKILRTKLRVFGRWEGYRCDGSSEEERSPWFRVAKACGILKGGQPYEHTVTVGCGSSNPNTYKIAGSAHKSEYRIKDVTGGLLAEVRRKHTNSGVALGDDVLTLVVEPNVDHLLIMGLVIVCGLINNSM